MTRSSWSIAACPFIGLLLCCQQAEVAPAPNAEAEAKAAPVTPELPVAGRVAVTITYCIP